MPANAHTAPEPLLLHRPMAAGIMLGLIRVIPMRRATAYRGPIHIMQGTSNDFTLAQNCLRLAAKQRRINLFADTAYNDLYFIEGPLGQVELTDCVRLTAPRCRFKYQDHYNLGMPQLGGHWGWAIAHPVLCQALGGPPPAPAPPSQPSLFVGA